MFTYAYGYKSRDHAWCALMDMFADGEVSESDRPELESYTNREGKRRWRILIDR
jgi:anti-sigma factor RsiW